MIFDNRLRIFVEFIENFPNDRPITKYLPEFFKRNKQMGSRDRKNLSQAIYSFFRLGNACSELPIADRLCMALFFTLRTEDAFVIYFKPEFATKFENSFEEKLEFVKLNFPSFNLEDVFPFHAHLSNGINKEAFLKAQFIQPDLFLRAIKGKEEKLKLQLERQVIPYKIEGCCIRLGNMSNVDSEEYLYEIQDQSSQYCSTFFEPQKNDYWWDCCAASGGKSLALHETEVNIRIFASDNRDSILTNLDERFKRAGITKYNRRTIDLLQEITSLEKESMDGIIVDAPCTGSGTWSRTPEMTSQFTEEKIAYFAELQKNILLNVVPFLKSGKPLVYITCSVFKEENEEQVAQMLASLPLTLVKMEMVKGYEKKADSMFVARLIKK